MIAVPSIQRANANVAAAGRPHLISVHRMGVSQSGSGAGVILPPVDSSVGRWEELRAWAEMFDDTQQFRIAQANRILSTGMDPTVFSGVLASIEEAEAACKKGLVGSYRRVVPEPIRAWQKMSPGIGDHVLARLLGRLGHPRIATPHHYEGTGASRLLVKGLPYGRTVRQLWQLCGHGDPARSRVRKGMSADELAELGSPKLKMLVHLMAESTMKQKRAAGLYRLVYEEAKDRYADRTHAGPCPRCGPSGKPAQPGSPWNLGHQHAAALRMVGKEILRDLWTVSG